MKRRHFLQTGLCTAATAVVKERPNILLLFSDQHNAGVLGAAGHPQVRTPALDRLASDGVRFTRAYCQDGVCLPSRASLMTGQFCRTLGLLHNPDVLQQPERFTTLPRVLRDAGYHTAAFGKRHLPPSLDRDWDYCGTTMPPGGEPSDEYYWDWVRRHNHFAAFERDWNAEFGYRAPGKRVEPLTCLLSQLPLGFTMEAYTAGKTIEYLRQAKQRGKPFFCWSSFYRPHQPYTPLPHYARRYPADSIALPPTLREPPSSLPPMFQQWRANHRNPWCLGRAAIEVDLYRTYIAYYYALVAEIDDHVARILATLEQEGLADNTIVIYTSDHGDFVGFHGMAEKCALGHNVYEDTLRVPLILRWPGRIRAGMRADGLTELIDLLPSLLEFVRVALPPGQTFPGRSFAPVVLRGQPSEKRYAISENWSQVAVIGERFKLGAWLGEELGGFGDLLFDRQTDPFEIGNLAGHPAAAEEEADMRQFLQEWATRYPPAKKPADSRPD